MLLYLEPKDSTTNVFEGVEFTWKFAMNTIS